MALPSQLTKFKAPGVKLLTEVVEQTPQAQAPQGARILIANSRKGPVNALTLVNNFTEYESMFDGISDADERRGNWSARSAQYMLDVSPIYVLNLRSFDDTLDLAGLQELSMEAQHLNKSAKTVAYTSLFNDQQFWKVDPTQLLKSDNADNLLVFGNVGSSSLSIFVRKTRTNQTNLTFEQWYRNLNRPMPAYVNPFDKVVDWMIDVVIFENKFDQSSSANANYGYCFNSDGSVKTSVVNTSNVTVDGLTQLTQIPEAGFLKTITGSLVEGFTDQYGNTQDVVRLINNDVEQVGLVAKINDQIFDNAAIWSEGDSVVSNGKKKPVPVDFAGHSLCNITEIGTFDLDAYEGVSSISVASYKFLTKVQQVEVSTATLAASTASIDQDSTLLSIDAILPAVQDGLNVLPAAMNSIYTFSNIPIKLGEKFVANDGNLASVTNVEHKGVMTKILGLGTILAPVQPYNDDVDYADSHDWEDADGADSTFQYADSGLPFPQISGVYVYPTDHILAGEPLVFDTETGYVIHNPNEANLADFSFQLNGAGLELQPDWDNLPVGYTPTATSELIMPSDISAAKINDDDTTNTGTKYDDLVEEFGAQLNVFKLTFDKQLCFNDAVGQAVEVDYEAVSPQSIVLDNSTSIQVYVNDYKVFNVKTFEQVSTKFLPINLISYTPRSAQFLDGTAARQTQILDTLLNTSLRDALGNQDLVRYNYLVDGFKSYIEPVCKNQLKLVVQDRILARAICNMPSIYDFKQSANPYFRESINGKFVPRYITLGGNTELPYSNTFSLPSESGWYAYFFGPNFTLSDGKSMPPAAVISNLFQLKYRNGKPYAILAGPGDGSISGRGIAGVEYTFNEKNDGTGDRDYLDPFGYNVILSKLSTGIQLYGNRTAANTVETAMSSIHTSEVVMYIQERIKSLLERFVFKYNTAQNRLVIKEEADSICAEPQGDGAISSFTNQMNEVNNNAEVIRNRIGILDTTIWSNNGMEILVHRTKIDTVTNTATFELL